MISARSVRIGWIFLLLPVSAMLSSIPGRAQNAEDLARLVQLHYHRLTSVKANFRQVYEANSIRQEENGAVWLRKPGQMRWEYFQPENKLFLADGKNTYFHIPSANQVTVRRLNSEDLHFTPFGFLVGYGDLLRDFEISTADMKPGGPASERALRLLPRQPMENVSAMILEIDIPTFQIRALTIHEYTGGTSRFEFSSLVENAPLESRLFSFRMPKGAEVVRLDEP